MMRLNPDWWRAHCRYGPVTCAAGRRPGRHVKRTLKNGMPRTIARYAGVPQGSAFFRFPFFSRDWCYHRRSGLNRIGRLRQMPLYDSLLFLSGPM